MYIHTDGVHNYLYVHMYMHKLAESPYIAEVYSRIQNLFLIIFFKGEIESLLIGSFFVNHYSDHEKKVGTASIMIGFRYLDSIVNIRTTHVD